MNTENDLSRSKSVLARLMASENITVHHRQVRTAYFDTVKRVLVCPIWTDMTGDIYDLLMGHEISHALHTPKDGWHDAIVHDSKRKNIKRFLNVIEDARIEKLIKRKYPGLRKPFVDAYAQLHERDLFKIKKLKGDYSKMNLIDRINLYFKLGAHTMVRFDKEEQVFVDRTANAETWEQVVQIARDVYDYCKFKEPKKAKEPQPETDSSPEEDDEQNEPGDDQDDTDDSGEDDGESGANDSEEGDDTDDGDADESDESEEGDTDSQDSDEESDDTDGDGSDSDASDEDSDEDSDEEGEEAAATSSSDADDSEDEDDDSTEGGRGSNQDDADEEGLVEEPESETDSAFREMEETLVDGMAKVPVYYDLPVPVLSNIIVPNEQVLRVYEQGLASAASYTSRIEPNVIAMKAAAGWMTRNKSFINLMIKEFEMKKNASQYARQLQSRTGVLDDTKLARYKFTNDIFRKVTSTTKGKSHGMILFLDMSSSMYGQFRPIMEQLLLLVAFSKRVGLPFDVYGFGDSQNYGVGGQQFKKTEATCGFSASKKFCLRHLISSKLSGSAYKRAFNMMVMMAYAPMVSGRPTEIAEAFAPNSTWTCALPTMGMDLGGTPYLQTLAASRMIIDQFKMANKVDITNVIYLTDGDGDQTVYVSEDVRNAQGFGSKGIRVGFHDPVTKLKVLSEEEGQVPMQAALTKLIAAVTGARHLGYYFGDYDAIKFKVTMSVEGDATKALGAIKANGYTVVPSIGYDSYYYVNTTSMSYSGALRINPMMDKHQMHTEFDRHQKALQTSKLVVKQFAGEIASEL